MPAGRVRPAENFTRAAGAQDRDASGSEPHESPDLAAQASSK
jgi:hypothetical protein